MGKGFTFSDVFVFYNGCTKEGIASAYFFIFGGPGETDATVKEGLANIRRLEEGVIFIYSGIRVLPGTSLYKVAIQEGVLSADDKLLEPVYYFSPEVNIDEMNMLIEQEAKKQEINLSPEKGKLMIDAMHAFGYRGLLWDELLKVTRKSERHRKRR
jgi:radical SAM superfamily enzyme YgiQ (UPF0313 family)